MSISPISPASPEPSWQRPRKHVSFSPQIEYYGGPGSAAFFTQNKKVDDEEGIELGHVSTVPARESSRPSSNWIEEHKKRKRMVCCLSRKTFIIVAVVTIFLLGALLGGVAATLINKKKPGQVKSSPPTPTSVPPVFPTNSHIPVPTPTSR